jgi:hypothetical protein
VVRRGRGWLRFEPTPRTGCASPRLHAGRAGARRPGGRAGDAVAAPLPRPRTGPINPDGSTALEGAVSTRRAVRRRRRGRAPRWLGGSSCWRCSSVALVPLARALRRRLRWRARHPAVAWHQVQDDALDVGHRWDPSESRGRPPRACRPRGRCRRGGGGARPARHGDRALALRPAGAAEQGVVGRRAAGRQRTVCGRPCWPAQPLASGGTPACCRSRRSVGRLERRRSRGGLLDRVDDGFAAVGRRLHRRSRQA